jgi:hypothetical protein
MKYAIFLVLFLSTAVNGYFFYEFHSTMNAAELYQKKQEIEAQGLKAVEDYKESNVRIATSTATST